MNDDLPLGRSVDYPTRYHPSVLRRIERRVGREEVGIPENLPFTGEDIWNCYELSWLAPSGLPQVGVLTLHVPAESPCIVESKSLKLYLNGLNGATFEDAEDVAGVIEADLLKETGSAVGVTIRCVGDLDSPRDFTSFCLDGQLVSTKDYRRDPGLLKASTKIGADAVHTHLFPDCLPDHGPAGLGVGGDRLPGESSRPGVGASLSRFLPGDGGLPRGGGRAGIRRSHRGDRGDGAHGGRAVSSTGRHRHQSVPVDFGVGSAEGTPAEAVDWRVGCFPI